MSRWVWMIVLLTFIKSGLAYGGWVSLAGDRNKGVTIYIDASAISRQGEQRAVWVLYDFNTVQTKEGGISFLSAKMQREYDCAKQRTRLRTILHYSDNMEQGDMVLESTLSDQEWAPVGPLESGTVAKDLWTLACSED